jgi:hypothetical protein
MLSGRDLIEEQICTFMTMIACTGDATVVAAVVQRWLPRFPDTKGVWVCLRKALTTAIFASVLQEPERLAVVRQLAQAGADPNDDADGVSPMGAAILLAEIRRPAPVVVAWW